MNTHLFSLSRGASLVPVKQAVSGKRLLNDFIFDCHPNEAEPFLGSDAAQDFHKAYDIEMFGFEPVMFTHNDLCPPNILITPGPNRRATAILNFGQSG